MNIRMATLQDIDQLVLMRWDFTLEHAPDIVALYKDFYTECKSFLESAISGGKWFIWVVELDNRVVSHIYIELIDKVPRPGRVTDPFAYMTNVYTLPGYRSQGIGSQLLERIEGWGREKQLEFIMVWPSDEAVPFYARNGYKHCTEPMELTLD
jgi:GNAT superfamily N-acetyltransferase